MSLSIFGDTLSALPSTNHALGRPAHLYDSAGRTTHRDKHGRQTGQPHRTSHGLPTDQPNPHHHRRDPATNQPLMHSNTGRRVGPGWLGWND